MLSRLFGRKDNKTSAAPPGTGVRRIDKRALAEAYGQIVMLPELDFIGRYSQSPNGRFTLLWRDGNDEGTVGGARASGHGRYYLIDGNQVVAEGRAERPNDGAVADNGTFILNDWRFSIELCGTFLAFRADGSPFLTRSFAANLLNNGLSADGLTAVCQACNAPNSPDSSRLVIFDLETGVETGNCVPESGWAAGYVFPGDGTVQLRDAQGTAFAYGLDGAFLDRECWIENVLARGEVWAIACLLRQAGDNPPEDFVRQALQSLERATGGASELQARALAYRLEGECREHLHDATGALASYDAALALDPKIGVKKRAEKLRRELSS